MSEALDRYRVRQGDSGPLLKVGVEGVATLDANWRCDIKVVDCDGADTGIERQVTDKDGASTVFLVRLTPTETGTLSPGTFTLGVQVTNDSATPTAFAREEHIKIEIIDGIVPAP